MQELYPQVRLRVRAETVFSSRGDTVLATHLDGSIEGEPEEGLFVHQTRLLSRHRITVGGQRPLLATGSNSRQDRWDGYLILPPPGDKGPAGALPQRASQEALEIALTRVVGEGLHEDIDLHNYTRQPIDTTMVIELDADFADPEETKGERKHHGDYTRTWSKVDGYAHELEIAYKVRRRYAHGSERGTATLDRAVRIRVLHATTTPRRQGKKLVFDLQLPPRGHWHACIEYVARIEGKELAAPDCMLRSGMAEADRTHAPFLAESTSFHSQESETLAPEVMAILEQARHDIAAMRLYRYDHGPRAWTVAAGVPMYIGLFGRDTLVAAWQAALCGTELLRGTLPALAELQGKKNNSWRDEQPGRILHEAHAGPLAQLQFKAKGRYYGSVSSSALFPYCLAQLWSWTGDREAVGPLIEPAMRALAWLDRVGAEGAQGFHAYKTRAKDGLENQSWKDSSDSLVDEDGNKVGQPSATCEEQGSVFAAKVAMAEVLHAFGRKDEAKRLFREANELRKRFNEAFWMEDLSTFAMALDPKGRQVRSVGSNALHCLSSGIADEALVPHTIERLFQADMFSGWGIRTLSSDHPAYNPYAYHRGTVWPVEHGPFAIGAYRANARERADQVARAIFEVATLFDSQRLPECFSGHQRDPAHPFPSLYPPANAPQAWSATTAFTLIQALLGLQPYAPHGLLLVDPRLPRWLPTLRLSGLRVADAVLDLRFFRKPDGTTDYEVEHQQGDLRVVQRASPWSMALQFGDSLQQLLAA